MVYCCRSRPTADPGGDSEERNQSQALPTSPRFTEPKRLNQQRHGQLQQKSGTPLGSPYEVEKTTPWSTKMIGGGRALLIGRDESNTERVEEVTEEEGRSGVAKDGGDGGSPNADGKRVTAVHGGRGGASTPVCEDELTLSAVRTRKHLCSSVGRSINEAGDQGERIATATPGKHSDSSVSSVNPFGIAGSGAVPSGFPLDEGMSGNTGGTVMVDQIAIPEGRRRTTEATSSAPTKPSSIRPSDSSPPKPAATQRPRPVLPPVRSVMPPRRDVRKSYLSSLGMRKGVMIGTGEERTPPPIIRRSPLYGVRNMRKFRSFYLSVCVGLR